MSVPKGKRKESKLELAVLARDHAKYVIQITNNPKIFLPEYNSAITSDLILQAKDINRCIWAANNIRVSSTYDYQLRHNYQKQALLTCITLLADIDIAKVVFHLSSKRIKYWTELIIEIKNKLKQWIQSDVTRYSQYR